MTDGYPSNLARGITMAECVDGENIKRCVFRFEHNNRCKYVDKSELSVEWLDDIDTVKRLKTRTSAHRPDPQFILGFAVLSREDLDTIRSDKKYSSMEYERSPSTVSKSHGLILFPVPTTPQEKSTLRDLSRVLAMKSKKYEFDQDLPVG